MGQVVLPVVAVNHAVGVEIAKLVAGVGAVGEMQGICRHMVYGIAAVGRKGHPKDVGRRDVELHRILYQERLGMVVGANIGTDKDKDAVACGDVDIAGYYVGVAIHIETEP